MNGNLVGNRLTTQWTMRKIFLPVRNGVISVDKRQAIAAISDVLSSLQALSGLPSTDISESTRPIGDLDEFDSLCGVEATAVLADRLGIEIPGVSAFVSKDGTSALSVSEIADAVCAIASGEAV